MQKLKTLDSREKQFLTKKNCSNLAVQIIEANIDAWNFLPWSQICGTRCLPKFRAMAIHCSLIWNSKASNICASQQIHCETQLFLSPKKQKASFPFLSQAFPSLSWPLFKILEPPPAVWFQMPATWCHLVRGSDLFGDRIEIEDGQSMEKKKGGVH